MIPRPYSPEELLAALIKDLVCSSPSCQSSAQEEKARFVIRGTDFSQPTHSSAPVEEEKQQHERSRTRFPSGRTGVWRRWCEIALYPPCHRCHGLVSRTPIGHVEGTITPSAVGVNLGRLSRDVRYSLEHPKLEGDLRRCRPPFRSRTPSRCFPKLPASRSSNRSGVLHQ